ncbi:MAG: chemotaxis protein CheW [Promethearchaeota archaeon]
MFNINILNFFDQFLLFSLESEIYAINTQKINEVILIPQIHAVPEADEILEGVINYHDNLIDLFNLRKIFQLPWKEYDNESRIIIIKDKQWTFGLLVDKVHDLLTIKDDEIIEIPSLFKKLDPPYIEGFYQRDRINCLIVNIDVISEYLVSHFKEL